MFDIKSFYEAKDVADAIRALEMDPDAEIISGGTDVLIRVREGKDAGRSLVSVHNLQELKGVKLLENGDLWAMQLIWLAVPRSATPEPSAAISATALPPPILPLPCGLWRQKSYWKDLPENVQFLSVNSILVPEELSAIAVRSAPAFL